MNQAKLKNALEAILFVAGAPVVLSDLAKLLGNDTEQIKQALTELGQDYESRGLSITHDRDSYQMVTSAETSPQVKNFLQGQLREKLTEAAVETLSIIAYKQPVSRAEIEAIRGVNSQYIIRLLLQRGLVEKVPNPADARMVFYQTTHEFLHHLGLKDVRELPEFDSITAQLNSLSNPEDGTEKTEQT